MGKGLRAIILEMASRMAKRSEIRDSELQVEHIWGTCDFILVKVIWGLFVALAIASSTLMILSQPCDSPHKVVSLNLEP